MKSARQDVVWATAVRTLDAQHRTTTWLRLACIAALWALLPLGDPDERGRVALQLVPVTAGVLLSHVHARPELLQYLAHVPFLGSRLFPHLTGTRGRAKFDLPGVLEGGGILLASTVYGGKWAVTGYSVNELSIALLAVTVFTWSVFLNVVLDAGYYAPRGGVEFGTERSAGPASRALKGLRHAIPPGVAALVALMFVPPWTPTLEAVPIALRIILVLSILSLRLAWLGYDQILAAAAETVSDAEHAARVKEAGELHSTGKNAVGNVLNALDSPNYKYSEVRSLLRNTLVQMEEAIRRARSGSQLSPTDLQPLGPLWQAAVAVLPTAWRARCALDAEAHELLLGPTDRQLVQRLISDLVTNAVRAGASSVRCSVRSTHAGRALQIEVCVQDNGPGMPPSVLDDPMTSLAVMARELSRYSGSLTFSPQAADGLGTVVRACWRSADIVKIPKPRSADPAPLPAKQKNQG
ncbi:ATP-binding protein [Streptomyces cyaneofuscatus]|uniref:ATP-binding protein n=1 Tax=Streptomyces cyaneofuscatus TaxID=66883 RepID=UPI00363D3E5F